jgi:xanthine dehydrogenase accessory factor
MHKHINSWKLLEKSLANNIPAALLYVLESKGSSPGRQGFFMVVNANNEMEGSVGGGIMEHKFVEMAKEHLKSSGYGLKTSIQQQVHDKKAGVNQSGMICSGEQTIFIYAPRLSDLSTIKEIILSIEQHRNGTLTLNPQGLFFSNIIPQGNYTFTFNHEDDWVYTEKTGYKNYLFIIGGGHCSLALSALMRGMDFYITVFETREALNTLEKNAYAHEKIIIDDYSALTNLIPAGPNQYIVIMTFGYRTDDLAMRALVGKNFKYFGLLGSRKKIEKLFADYKDEGISEHQLNKIHAPVGIPVSSQTPEEIAISIAAEIIKVKNSD